MISRIRLFALLLLAFALTSAACSKTRKDAASTSLSGTRPTIIFMTDFGTSNDAVAICKAVMLGIAPDARILDLTHHGTPYSIQDRSTLLAVVPSYYLA